MINYGHPPGWVIDSAHAAYEAWKRKLEPDAPAWSMLVPNRHRAWFEIAYEASKAGKSYKVREH